MLRWRTAPQQRVRRVALELALLLGVVLHAVQGTGLHVCNSCKSYCYYKVWRWVLVLYGQVIGGNVVIGSICYNLIWLTAENTVGTSIFVQMLSFWHV